MKALLVLLSLAGGLWLWRSRRRIEKPAPPHRSQAAPQAMTRCAVCGLHLPEADAVKGSRGVYCGTAHRQQAEG